MKNKAYNRITKGILLGLMTALFCTGCGGVSPKGGDDDAADRERAESIAMAMAAEAETEMRGIESQMAETETKPETETETQEDTANNVIIVLDPGHDSEYCARNHPELGVNEQDLNLTIGLACRDRLREYKGVTVYMTREDGTCPDPESYGEFCIEKRTGFGTEMGADLFVALHCNASTGVLGASAGGAEVYVSSYPAYTEDCTRLGELILAGLEGVGVSPNGVILRQKEEKGTYDDGTVQDWYYLISESVEGGHPGIIIEHAYMDNSYDNELLRNEDTLIAMGIADADAMAAYYGLELRAQ